MTRRRPPAPPARRMPPSRSPTKDHENCRVHPRWWPKRRPWHGETALHGEAAAVAPCCRNPTVQDLAHDPTLEHQVRAEQPVVRRQQCPEQCVRDGVRRVCHHPEGKPWPSQSSDVGIDDRDLLVREALSQVLGSTRVTLNGNHVRACREQTNGQRTLASAYVDDHIASRDARGGDDPRRPRVSERVPTPKIRLLFRGG